MTRARLPASIAAASLLALAAAARAQTPADPGHDLVAAAFAKPVADSAPAAGPAITLRYAKAAEDRASRSSTALDHQFSPDGVVGSVGYLCGIDKYQPDSYQHGGGPNSTYGHEGTFLGASLGVSFK